MKTSHNGQTASLGSGQRIGMQWMKAAWYAGALAVALIAMQAPARAQDLTELEKKYAKYKDVGLARVTSVGTVVGTKLQERELTVTESFGNQLTLKVDQSVPDLDKLKAGDTVRLVFFLIGRAEVRDATAEEKKNPSAVVDPKTLDENPYGKDVQIHRVVTTIDGLDRAVGTVTFKGPKGYQRVVKVKNTKVFDEYKIGDTVVVTYAEPMVMWLAKVDAPKAK